MVSIVISNNLSLDIIDLLDKEIDFLGVIKYKKDNESTILSCVDSKSRDELFDLLQKYLYKI